MITIPPTKTQQSKLASQMRVFQKQQEKLAEQVSAPLKPHDPSLLPAIIVDIDGTLAHKCERGWYEHEKVIGDFPCEALIGILGATTDSTICPQIIVVSGREEIAREATEAWLKLHNVPFDALYMRRTGDRRASNIVKEDIYIEHIRDKWNILFCVDDRKQDIDMYRSHGLYCFIADNSRE